MLTAVVEDMHLQQTSQEQLRKSHVRGSARTMEASGRLHAVTAYLDGYAFEAVLAEFRALCASVLRLYDESGASNLSEVRRFNEAIDGVHGVGAPVRAESDLLREELNASGRNVGLATSCICQHSDGGIHGDRVARYSVVSGMLLPDAEELPRRTSPSAEVSG